MLDTVSSLVKMYVEHPDLKNLDVGISLKEALKGAFQRMVDEIDKAAMDYVNSLAAEKKGLEGIKDN